MYKFEKNNKQGILKISISAQDWEKALQNAYEENKGRFNIQGLFHSS